MAINSPEEALQAVDDVKAHVESTVGKREPSNTVTPLSRFEELHHLYKQALEHVLSLPWGAAKTEEG